MRRDARREAEARGAMSGTTSPSDDAIRALFPFAQAENPDIHVAEEDFVAYVRARFTDAAPTPEAAAQLYFALACVRGDPAALRAFEARYTPLLLRMARRAKLA